MASYIRTHSLRKGSASEKRDFLDEAIIIADQLQKSQRTKILWQENTQDYQDAEKKYLHLNNWLALSLVRQETDRVALAVYLYNDKFQALYAKQLPLNEEDVTHANEFVRFLNESASTIKKVGRLDFQKGYFSLMLRNCESIITSRYNDLKNSFF